MSHQWSKYIHHDVIMASPYFIPMFYAPRCKFIQFTNTIVKPLDYKILSLKCVLISGVLIVRFPGPRSFLIESTILISVMIFFCKYFWTKA